MSCEYTVTEERIRDEAGEHIAFGIVLRSEEGVNIARLPSLFFSRRKAECFSALCNRLSLSPRHLTEVAEDILAEQ